MCAHLVKLAIHEKNQYVCDCSVAIETLCLVEGLKDAQPHF